MRSGFRVSALMVLALAQARSYGATPSAPSTSTPTQPNVVETVLYETLDYPEPLLEGADGNFYGTTFYGGKYNSGTVLRLTPDGVVSVLYSFSGGSVSPVNSSKNGGEPQTALLQDAQGNLYGTTTQGGEYGLGTVFRVNRGGYDETILHSFDGHDGWSPQTPLIRDQDGNLYGTALMGGGVAQCEFQCGTVFRISAAGTFTVLHAFAGLRADGGAPTSLLLGRDGNLYGTTQQRGAFNGGAIFKITPDGTESLLYSFNPGPSHTQDGSAPTGLVQGSDGSLYGTTASGGTYDVGTVFKVTLAGAETVLHSFSGIPAGANSGGDGSGPMSGLIAGSDGNFYGTTWFGGTDQGDCFFTAGCGVVFRITPAGAATIVYAFGSDGNAVNGADALIEARDGNFYGTTHSGQTYQLSGVIAPSSP